MTKKDVIWLADTVRRLEPGLRNWYTDSEETLAMVHQWETTVVVLGDSLEQEYPRFNKKKWLTYIYGYQKESGSR